MSLPFGVSFNGYPEQCPADLIEALNRQMEAVKVPAHGRMLATEFGILDLDRMEFVGDRTPDE